MNLSLCTLGLLGQISCVKVGNSSQALHASLTLISIHPGYAKAARCLQAVVSLKCLPPPYFAVCIKIFSLRFFFLRWAQMVASGQIQIPASRNSCLSSLRCKPSFSVLRTSAASFFLKTDNLNSFSKPIFLKTIQIFKALFVFPLKELCNSFLTSSKKISTHKKKVSRKHRTTSLKALPESSPYNAIPKTKVLIQKH